MLGAAFITSYCTIKPWEVSIDGAVGYVDNGEFTTADFLKNIYKSYNVDYPKFHKMDNLCKLGLLNAELLIRNSEVTQKYKPEEIAIVLTNSASSLDVDQKYQATIQEKDNFFPSPAVFVYTLPNILIGEIAIKYKITGENAFFIAEQFDPHFMNSYISNLLNTNKARCCIAGWVEFYNNSFNSFLYAVEQQPGKLTLEHTTEILGQIF